MKRIIILFAVILSLFPFALDAQTNTSVSFTRTSDGTYDINPGDGYYIEEHYTIYAVQRYPQADSIVFEFGDQEWDVSGTFHNQRLTFTIHNHNASIDYYVLYVERDGLESHDKLYRQFADGDTVLVQDSNEFDFYLTDAQSWDLEAWHGEFGRYCTVDSSQNSQGEWQFANVSLNWAEFTDTLAYPWLNVCSLSPGTVMALWDDSLDTESGYRLEYSYWQQGSEEWSTSLGIDLPANYSGYCINGVQPGSLYRIFCFPLGVSDPDTLCGFVKTYAESDISSDQALHYLPYAPVTATDYDNGIMAFTFIRGWSHADRTIYYDHLLIKRQSGHFTLVELNRSELENDFYITDVAVSDRSVYVSDDQGGLCKVHMPDASTTEKSSLSVDFGDGHVKAMENRHGKIYLAIKYPQAIMGGSQPALGILDSATDHVSTHSHPDVASGGDRIAVGEHWVYVAENFPDGSGGFSSFIVRYNLQGEREVPFMTPMSHQSAQQGIIDMAVNPVTGELVYLSPTFGLYGSYGDSYNALLPPPSSFSTVTPTSIGFTPEGSLLLSHPQEPKTCSSNNIYQSVTTPVLPKWNEQEYWQDAPLAMGFFGLLSATPGPEDVILLKIAGVTAITGVTAIALSRLLDMQLSMAPYHLGQAEYMLQKHVIVEEQVEIDLELLNETRRIMGREPDHDPDPDPMPVPWPFPFPQPRPVKPDTQPKECEITDYGFTNGFYSWDDYHSRVMSGSPPFDHIQAANRECVGAFFSKFILVERINGEEKEIELYVSSPLTYQTRHLYPLQDLRLLFEAKPECYDSETIKTGWISYGPWKRHETGGTDIANYFLLTNGTFGPESYGQKCEYMKSPLYYLLQTFIASKPYLSKSMFFFANPSAPEYFGIPRGALHPNMPAPCEDFQPGAQALRTMGGNFWLLDSRMRTNQNLYYYKDPVLRKHLECFFDPVTNLITSVETGKPVSNSGTSSLVAIGCNERLYMNYTQSAVPMQVTHHSELLAGAAVVSAGHFHCRNGKPEMINNFSGHYEPPTAQLEQTLALFRRYGWQEEYRRPNPVEPIATDVYFDTRVMNTQLNLQSTGSTAGQLSIAAGLYSTSHSAFATDVTLNLIGNDYSATSVSADGQSYQFDVPVEDLENSRNLNFWGVCETDTLLYYIDYTIGNPSLSDNDTLGTFPDYVHWLPAVEFSNMDQQVWMAEQQGNIPDETSAGERINFLVHIIAEHDPSGTLCFRFLHEETHSGHNTAIYHKTATGEWTELPTLLNDSGDYFQADIQENGLYGLFVSDPEMPEPVLYFPFDGHSQDQANGLDAQSVDNVGYTQGQLEEAAHFDGSDDDGDQRADCFEITDSPLLQASDALSICAWVKADPAEGYQTLLNKWYTLDSYSLGLINDELVLSVSYPNGSWGDVYDVRTPMPVGIWTHVAGVLDGNTLSLYLNGDCVATATTPGGTIQASVRPVVIGDHPNGSGFQGCMDELYFYTTALNAGQINYLVETIHQPDDSRTFSIQALLQGPFSTQTGTMDNTLARSGSLPFDSPFDESYWASEGMPDSLVDWMWLELLPQVDAEPAWQTSALISVNGWLCTPEGSTEFAPPLQGNSYFLRLVHRNHMPALSASPVSLNPGVNAVYRFRTTGSHFHSSTPGIALDGSNWGLHGGDINGDGMVTSADYVIWYNQTRMSSEGSAYVDGDLNLDGSVDALDYDLWYINARRQPTAAGADAQDVQNDE